MLIILVDFCSGSDKTPEMVLSAYAFQSVTLYTVIHFIKFLYVSEEGREFQK